ncbi:MAG: hypothetical protein RI894_446 [Bacteroidota bacterium]|jgi:hypothetical protein
MKLGFKIKIQPCLRLTVATCQNGQLIEFYVLIFKTFKPFYSETLDMIRHYFYVISEGFGCELFIL